MNNYEDSVVPASMQDTQDYFDLSQELAGMLSQEFAAEANGPQLKDNEQINPPADEQCLYHCIAASYKTEYYVALGREK